MHITLNNIQKVFGTKVAVDIEHLEIDNGIVGLVGNNGAGKTTLFRLMLDLIKLDRGDIHLSFSSIEGDIQPSLDERWKDHTGAYIDEGFLIDFLTPEEYFDFVGKANGMTKDQIMARVQEFDTFMADEILGQKKLIRDYSAGNKHKIGIMAALLHCPELVILDEPFNFLDPSSQNNLKKLLSDYSAEHDALVIVSSHNLQHTVDISSRILLLEHGKLIQNIDNSNGEAESILDSYFMN